MIGFRVINCERNKGVITTSCAKALNKIRIKILHLLAKFLGGNLEKFGRSVRFDLACFVSFELEQTKDIWKGNNNGCTGDEKYEYDDGRTG